MHHTADERPQGRRQAPESQGFCTSFLAALQGPGQQKLRQLPSFLRPSAEEQSEGSISRSASGHQHQLPRARVAGPFPSTAGSPLAVHILPIEQPGAPLTDEAEDLQCDSCKKIPVFHCYANAAWVGFRYIRMWM